MNTHWQDRLEGIFFLRGEEGSEVVDQNQSIVQVLATPSRCSRPGSIAAAEVVSCAKISRTPTTVSTTNAKPAAVFVQVTPEGRGHNKLVGELQLALGEPNRRRD